MAKARDEAGSEGTPQRSSANEGTRPEPQGPEAVAQEAARGFFADIRKLQADLQRQAQAATSEIMRLPGALQEEVRKRAIDLVTRLVEAIRTGATQPDVARRIEEAYRQYNADLQKLQEDIQRNVDSAVKKYSEGLKALPDLARDGMEEAFRKYIEQIRATVGGIDPATFGAESAGTLSQSMFAVAMYARAGLAQMGNRA